MNRDSAPHFAPWRFVPFGGAGSTGRILDNNNSTVLLVPSPANRKSREDAEWVANAPDRENIYRSVAFQMGAFRDYIDDVSEFLGDNYNVSDKRAVELHQRATLLQGYKRVEERLAALESARVRS